MPNKIDKIHALFAENIQTQQRTLDTAAQPLAQAAELIISALEQGNKVLSCGNGGSAGDAQHFSSELVNRFETERRALPAIALTTESSTLTAIANDYQYQYLFARQIEALAKPGDVLLGFSTSGNSANVCIAIETAQKMGLNIIVMDGKDGGKMATLLRKQDIELRVASDVTARIQETHLLFIHTLCTFIDAHFTQA